MSALAAIGAVAAALAQVADIGMGIYGLVETDRQKKRQASETRVRAYYDALENRLGVTMNQIDQFLEDLGFKNTRAIDLIRGTSRTGVAHKIYSAIMTEYPEVKKQYQDARNKINGIVNDLMTKEESRISKIQAGKNGDYNLHSINKDLTTALGNANSIITNLNGREPSGETNQIDTAMVDKSREQRVLENWESGHPFGKEKQK